MKSQCKMAKKSQVLLQKTIQNTRIVFLKTMQKLKAFLLDGYPKSSKAFIIRQMFFKSNGKRKCSDSDDFWQSTLDVMDNAFLLKTMENNEREQEECSMSTISMPVSDMSVPKGREQVARKLEYRHEGERRELSSPSIDRKLKYRHEGKRRELSSPSIDRNLECRQGSKRRELSSPSIERKLESRQESKRRELSSPSIERKLKQLEMMEPSDVEHVLDIEEVLHYYSRLTSPVYVEIVDTFCTDMYNEYTLLPQSSGSIAADDSARRLGPVKL